MAEAEAKMKQFNGGGAGLDAERGRFPYCVVWTPIPVLTWLFPIIGHMGICTSTGVIRDFAGPYFVSVLETGSQQSLLHQSQRLGHGCTRCLGGVQAPHGTAPPLMSPLRVGECPPRGGWVLAESLPELGSLKDKISNPVALFLFQHNLCCDNCHSHVALALNLMRYDNSTSWNMVKLCFFSLLYGKYVSIGGFVKTWLPFVLFLGVIVTIVLTLHLR
uniref:Transmembrane protein 222 n=1 Tax=Calidris pygmaea TaxID=425635 RepID=A0A8C3J3J3_9CHAR